MSLWGLGALGGSGDVSYQEMCTFFERYEPLMPDAARYLEQWQATQTKDNTMTAAPFGSDIPVRISVFPSAVGRLGVLHRLLCITQLPLDRRRPRAPAPVSPSYLNGQPSLNLYSLGVALWWFARLGSLIIPRGSGGGSGRELPG